MTYEASTDNKLSALELKELQKSLLNIAVTVRDILEHEGIPYSLAFGSLLGAVRHQGFIPWDDDFDFFVLEEDYDSAVKALKEKIPQHLMVHSRDNDPMYFCSWVKIKDTRITIEVCNRYHRDNARLSYKHPTLDLYRLERLKFGEVASFLTREAEQFFQRKLESKLITPNEYDLHILNIPNFVTNKTELFTKLPGETEVLFFPLSITTPLIAEKFFPLTKFSFENTHFFGPNDPEDFLLKAYGDFKKLPNQSNRKPNVVKLRST